MFLDRGFAIVVFFPAEVHGSVRRVARRSSHLGRWLQGLWACLCTKPKKAISSVDKAQVHVHMEVACTFLRSSSMLLSLCHFLKLDVETPRANPCHGQGGRCQVSRGHLSPADVHNERHEHQCPLGLVVHRQEHWHLSSDGKKVPAASGGTWHQKCVLQVSECSFSPTRLSCLDLEFLSGLSMSTKFAVCFEFHFCWTSYSCLRSGGCGHGAGGYLDNKSTEH